MELTHEFTVPASIDEAWAAFNDLERIAPCFPGAALTSYDGEAFEGLVKVKLGPISLQYNGAGAFLQRDETAHHAVIEAKGKDRRGNGTAAATVTADLAVVDDTSTKVTVATDLNITGKPAQFGRGVMQDVSDKLLAQFAACLETKLGAAAAAGEPSAAAVPPDTESSAPAGTAEAEAPAAAEPPGASSTASESSGAAGPAGATQPSAGRARHAAPPPTPRAEPQASPTTALDLGSTVVPVLVRRYAPYAIAAVVALWVLKRLVFRRR